MWNEVKKGAVNFLIVSIFLSGILFAVVTSYKVDYRLNQLEIEVTKSKEDTKSSFEIIKEKLARLLLKQGKLTEDDLNDLISSTKEIPKMDLFGITIPMDLFETHEASKMANKISPSKTSKAWMSFDENLLPVYFDFNKYALTNSAKETLEKNVAWLRKQPSVKLLLEGHADERGAKEYNMALGDRRAKSVQNYLVELGVMADISTITFGEERPVCLESNEACLSKNKRVEFKIISR